MIPCCQAGAFERMRILFCANWNLKWKGPGRQYAFFSHWDPKPQVRLLGTFDLGPVTRFEKTRLRFYILAPLAAFFLSFSRDLVIAYSAQVGLPLAFFLRLCFWRRIPLIVFDVESFGRIKKGPGLALLRFASKRIDHVVYAASGQKEYYRRYLEHLSNKSTYIPIGIGNYDKERKLGEKGKGAIVAPGHHGRAFRDWATLFQAFNLLSSEAKLLVVGRESIEEKEREGVPIPSGTSFLPFLPMREFKAKIEDAPFVVLPLPEREQSLGQLSVLFCMAMGKAVVASKVMGIEDYVENGVTGLLVNAGDPGSMAEAIERLVRDPEEAAMMGVRAFERLQRKFRDEAMGGAWEKLAHDLVSRT
jgi:glycosyltransferase involved in cell wall biosynthesis